MTAAPLSSSLRAAAQEVVRREEGGGGECSANVAHLVLGGVPGNVRGDVAVLEV